VNATESERAFLCTKNPGRIVIGEVQRIFVIRDTMRTMKSSLETLVWLLTGLHVCLCCPLCASELSARVNLQSYSGEYTFNASCTDEGAMVKVIFRKARDKDPVPAGTWVADGVMDSGVRGTTIQFQCAHVDVDDKGVVTVSAQFFGFSIEGRTLTWQPNYDRALYKDGDEKAAEKADEERKKQKENSPK
jgi:hypothetical protein